MHDLFISILAIGGTIFAYFVATWLYRRFYTPFLLPVAMTTFLIIIILAVCNVNYDTYMIGAKWIDMLLGPAVVALAYPLYQNRDILQKFALPIICGTFIGAVVGITTGIFLAKLIGFEDTIIYSLTPKSVTTPVAMEISRTLTGLSSLSAVFVMIAGIFGAMISTFAFRLMKIDHTVGKGIGLGSASHAIGTSRALENSLEEGSVSTIAMILSAVFVSIIAPLFVGWMM